MLANLTKWDSRFLDLAKLVSTWSKDPSTQTGAVIVRPDKSVVAVGFNGFPRNMLDLKELYDNREEKYSRIVHCEMNALLSSFQSVRDCTLYTYPFLSCDRCAVHMIQAGIVRFVAPICPPDKAVRWEEQFKKTRRYAMETGVEISEVNYV